MNENKPDYLTQICTRRLPGYDYSQPGAYFITIVTENRVCLFGHILNAKLVLTEIGRIVRDEWLTSVQMRREIDLDCWMIMPNHVHGVIFINDFFYARQESHNKPGLYRKPKSLSTFVSGFKSAVSRRINKLRGGKVGSIWQYNYHDHIIRDEKDFDIKRQYIIENPVRWEDDDLYI